MDNELRQALAGLTVSVEVAGRALGLSRNSAYSAVKSGQIPSIRIGGSIRVPTAPLGRMLGLDAREAA